MRLLTLVQGFYRVIIRFLPGYSLDTVKALLSSRLEAGAEAPQDGDEAAFAWHRVSVATSWSRD